MCGRLVNLDTVARVLAEYYHIKTDTQLAALNEALSRVPAVSVGGGYRKDHIGDSNKMVGDLISRAAALEAMDTWDKFGCDPDGKLVRYDDDNHYVPYVHYDDMVHAIKALPSAQTGRQKGKWLPDNNNYYEERFICSVCGKSYKVDTCMGKPMWNFCPCGADMRGENGG